MRITVEELVAALGLEPHSEGGFFRETYRAQEVVETPRGGRAAYTTILFLVTAAAVSRLHRLSSDELWVFQDGLPLELVTLTPDGELSRTLLGDATEHDAPRAQRAAPAPTEVAQAPTLAPAEVTHGHAPAPAWLSRGLAPTRVSQGLVSAGHWQGARLAGGAQLPAECAWSLVTCVVTPGFEYEDFEMGDRTDLTRAYPQHAALIRALT